MQPVLIVGGGIGGLTAALALARNGIASRVFEARESMPREGAGIQLGPNATRILQDLGVGEALEPHVVTPDCIIVHDGVRGGELARLPLGNWIGDRHGAPYWVVQRPALLEALWRAAETQELVALEPGRSVAQIGDNVRSREVTAELADGETVAGSVLVGADGLRSQVRGHVNGKLRLRYSGVAAARTLIPLNRVRSEFAEWATGVWLAPRTHTVHYPVAGGEQLAVVAIGPCDEPEDSWSVAVETDVVAGRFRHLPDAVRDLLNLSEDWRQWALYVPEGPMNWSHGRCVLIGDAAHPILPFLAQGGAMAIEDGFELAGRIAGGMDDPASALAAFGEQRHGRVARVQAASIANGRSYHLDGFAAMARNAALRTVPGELFMRRYDWIYGYRAKGGGL